MVRIQTNLGLEYRDKDKDSVLEDNNKDKTKANKDKTNGELEDRVNSKLDKDSVTEQIKMFQEFQFKLFLYLKLQHGFWEVQLQLRKNYRKPKLIRKPKKPKKNDITNYRLSI